MSIYHMLPLQDKYKTITTCYMQNNNNTDVLTYKLTRGTKPYKLYNHTHLANFTLKTLNSHALKKKYIQQKNHTHNVFKQKYRLNICSEMHHE